MSEKQVLILTIAAMVIVALVGGGAVWWLQFKVLAEKNRNLQEVKRKVAEARAKIDKIPQLKKDLEETQAKIQKLQDAIPNLDREEYDRFANRLDEIRRNAGVFIPTARWVVPTKAGRGPVAVPATMHKVQYDMQVRGTFYQLLRYVNLLEEEKRFINVESFSITPGSERSSPGQFLRDMKLVLYSFTYRPPGPEAPLKPPAAKTGVTTAVPE